MVNSRSTRRDFLIQSSLAAVGGAAIPFAIDNQKAVGNVVANEGSRADCIVTENHFTDRARKVMKLANKGAVRLNQVHIGTEHILLGLAKEGSGVAANILNDLGVDHRTIWLEIEKIVASGPDKVPKEKLPLTPKARNVINYSMQEAQKMSHNYVGTEHLLLGLLREQEGVAAQILMNLGQKLEDVRQEVLNLLGHGMDT